MTKIKKWKTIFHKQMDDFPTWKDIKHIDFEDDDRLRISYEEPYYSENNSHDGYFYIEVEREFEETDEEYEKRMKRVAEDRESLRKQRYKNYLRLKEEFENDVLC